MCFMTPKRLRWGKAWTISVVVRGPCRKRSRIDRLVLSDRAFHTPSSSSSGTLLPLPVRVGGAILRDSVQNVLPAGRDTLAIFRVNQADCTMTEIHMRSAGPLFQLHFQMVQR